MMTQGRNRSFVHSLASYQVCVVMVSVGANHRGVLSNLVDHTSARLSSHSEHHIPSCVYICVSMSVCVLSLWKDIPARTLYILVWRRLY